MDFQKASGHLADSKVYILTECYSDEPTDILAVFATKIAAEMAKSYYERKYHKKGYWYEIDEREVLDQATISKGERPKTAEVGEGSTPNSIPTTGA